MFANSGKKVKIVGVIFFIFGSICSVWGSIKLFETANELKDSFYSSIRDTSGDFIFWGIMCLIGGILLSYLLSILMVAFGDLVENTDIIRKHIENGKSLPLPVSQTNQHNTNTQQTQYPQQTQPIPQTQPYKPDLQKAVICPSCRTDNKSSATFCRNCGIKLK